MHDLITSPMTSSFSAHNGADAASECTLLQLLLESVATQVVTPSLGFKQMPIDVPVHWTGCCSNLKEVLAQTYRGEP